MSKRRQSRTDSFSGTLENLPISALADASLRAKEKDVLRVIEQGRARSLHDFAALLSPEAIDHIETMAQLSQQLTRQHFGKAMRLFSPIYLSNECVNVCKYCGFSRHNNIPRITIPIEQAISETKKLAKQGFRSLLIVAGEHPKYVSNGYVENVIKSCHQIMPSLSIELGPMETKAYEPLVRAGCEGLITYQETYHQPTYEELHTEGPKQFYNWRLDTVERGYRAGFRRLGIGALFGLYDWRHDAISVAAHALYLLRHCWKASLSISLPRMRPAHGSYQSDPEFAMSDRSLVQAICALRLLLPTAGLTLSTREPAHLRDGLSQIGITLMSAGSCTEPGGYSHFDETQWQPTQKQPGEQFEIADNRSPAEVATMLREKGYEPVWKDFDQALIASA